MRVFDENKQNEIKNYDLTKGYLREDVIKRPDDWLWDAFPLNEHDHEVYEKIFVFVPYSEEEIRDNNYVENKKRLAKLSEDIVQHIAGENVPNIEKIKTEFIKLHNKVRRYEGKPPRGKL